MPALKARHTTYTTCALPSPPTTIPSVPPSRCPCRRKLRHAGVRAQLLLNPGRAVSLRSALSGRRPSGAEFAFTPAASVGSFSTAVAISGPSFIPGASSMGSSGSGSGSTGGAWAMLHVTQLRASHSLALRLIAHQLRLPLRT